MARADMRTAGAELTMTGGSGWRRLRLPAGLLVALALALPLALPVVAHAGPALPVAPVAAVPGAADAAAAGPAATAPLRAPPVVAVPAGPMQHAASPARPDPLPETMPDPMSKTVPGTGRGAMPGPVSGPGWYPFLRGGAMPAVPRVLTGAATGSVGRPPPRPDRIAAPAAAAVAGVAGSDSIRCTADGAICIHAASYTSDVCAAIDRSATEAGIDPHFLARLLWQESLFDPAARSPVGAQGIAQFMPSTAVMVGLDDPWNPAKAILASARYLRSLHEGLGNPGLAAIAYNGGEARAAGFVAGTGGLPRETRAYVAAITGHDALTWRDAPPQTLDLRLAGDTPFTEACIRLAGTRAIRSLAAPPPMAAWGVIVASHPNRAMAQGYADRLQTRLAPVLDGRPVELRRKRLAGTARLVYTAQIGHETRRDADAMCSRLKRAGGRCIVLRN